LKFFLNLSKEEQRKRLLRRLEKEKHNWKFSPGDLEERALWDKYQACYEEAIRETSLPHAPWYVIPADNKETARVLVAKVIHETIIQLKGIAEPELDDAIKAKLEEYRAILKHPE